MGAFLSRLVWGTYTVSDPELNTDDDRSRSHSYEEDERIQDCTQSQETSSSSPTKPPQELQRIQETTVEREKQINETGGTRETTQYTTYIQSTKILDKNEHISDPFTKPVLVKTSFAEFQVPQKLEMTNVQEKIHPVAMPAATKCQVANEAASEQDVTDAIVKIQAGVRGYLTRKALSSRTLPNRSEEASEEKREGGVQDKQEIGLTKEATIFPKQTAMAPTLCDRQQNKSVVYEEEEEEEEEEEDEEEEEEEEDEEQEEEEENTVCSVQERRLPSDMNHTSENGENIEADASTVSQAQAATRIQAAFRGYKVRKQKRLRNDEGEAGQSTANGNEETL